MKVVGLISKVSPVQIALRTYCLTAKLLFRLSVIFQSKEKKIEKSSSLPQGCMTYNLQNPLEDSLLVTKLCHLQLHSSQKEHHKLQFCHYKGQKKGVGRLLL